MVPDSRMRLSVKNDWSRRIIICLSMGMSTIFAYTNANAQVDSSGPGYNLAKQKDVNGMLRKLFKKKTTAEPSPNALSVTMLPVLGYNPSFGFNIGINLMLGKQFGLKSNTIYSVFNASATYSTKGVATLRARHNMFTPGNKWNWQGDWQFSSMGIVDYGIGTGNNYRSSAFYVNDMPTKNSDSSFPIKYSYIQFFEKAYRKVGRFTYVGLGVDFNIFEDIVDEKKRPGKPTPHQLYSQKHGFDSTNYSANGFLLAFQFNSREHPVRSYGGVYADLNIRFNQTWMGSTKNSVVVFYDVREYFKLSKNNPQHVLAFWQWASFRVGGQIPYLEMAGTAHDMYTRSGRAYTFGRFKGPSYACFESEYRFPITANKLLSGVCFVTVQTASDDRNKKVFNYWEPGVGAGLRILFDKNSRSCLCLDFAKGKYGSSGVFCGLNEVF